MDRIRGWIGFFKSGYRTKDMLNSAYNKNPIPDNRIDGYLGFLLPEYQATRDILKSFNPINPNSDKRK